MKQKGSGAQTHIYIIQGPHKFIRPYRVIVTL